MRAGWQKTLVIVVKAPLAGRAKTRLAKGIGKARAVSFYRQSTEILVDRLAGDSRWQTVLAVDPLAAAGRGWAHLWGDLPRLAQSTTMRGGDLGARLRHIERSLPPGPAVIIGSDAPQISRVQIADAFKKLDGHDAVAGPASDGGYWLIGLRRLRAAPHAFLNVRWSGEHALADTLKSLPQTSAVSKLSVLDDVDELEDLTANPTILLRSINHR